LQRSQLCTHCFQLRSFGGSIEFICIERLCRIGFLFIEALRAGKVVRGFFKAGSCLNLRLDKASSFRFQSRISMLICAFAAWICASSAAVGVC
jgi:hypothetical protein